jgi:hypothetical protein
MLTCHVSDAGCTVGATCVAESVQPFGTGCGRFAEQRSTAAAIESAALVDLY